MNRHPEPHVERAAKARRGKGPGSDAALKQMIISVERVAYDCDIVSQMSGVVGTAEARTWRSIASRLRAIVLDAGKARRGK